MRVFVIIFIIIGYSINIIPFKSLTSDNTTHQNETSLLADPNQSVAEMKGSTMEKSNKKYLFPFLILGVWLLAGGMVNSRVRNFESTQS